MPFMEDSPLGAAPVQASSLFPGQTHPQQIPQSSGVRYMARRTSARSQIKRLEITIRDLRMEELLERYGGIMITLCHEFNIDLDITAALKWGEKRPNNYLDWVAKEVADSKPIIIAQITQACRTAGLSSVRETLNLITFVADTGKLPDRSILRLISEDEPLWLARILDRDCRDIHLLVQCKTEHKVVLEILEKVIQALIGALYQRASGWPAAQWIPTSENTDMCATFNATQDRATFADSVLNVVLDAAEAQFELEGGCNIAEEW